MILLQYSFYIYIYICKNAIVIDRLQNKISISWQTRRKLKCSREEGLQRSPSMARGVFVLSMPSWYSCWVLVRGPSLSVGSVSDPAPPAVIKVPNNVSAAWERAGPWHCSRHILFRVRMLSVKVMMEDAGAISDTAVPDRDWGLATYSLNDIRKYKRISQAVGLLPCNTVLCCSC